MPRPPPPQPPGLRAGLPGLIVASRGAGSRQLARPSGPGRSSDCGADTSAGPLPHCQPGFGRPACDVHCHEEPRPPPPSPPRIAPRLPAPGLHAAPAAGLRSCRALRRRARSRRSHSRLAPSRPRRPYEGPAPGRQRPHPRPANLGSYWLLFPPFTLGPAPGTARKPSRRE